MPTDRSGFRYETRDLTRNEKLKLNTILRELRKSHAIEHTFVMLIQDFIYQRISPSALAEYYKGAHIVFNDNGTIYAELSQFVESPDIQNYYRYAKDSNVPKNQRRAPHKLSSHYTVGGGFATNDENDFPQIGIDLSTGGHILFGLVPDDDGLRAGGNTFIQTEAYGFQNVGAVAMHGWGFLVSATGNGNSGILGYSPHSEKERKEIREHEANQHPYEQLIFDARMPPFDWQPVQQKLENYQAIHPRQDKVVQYLFESGLEQEEFELSIDPQIDINVEIEYRCPSTGANVIYVRKRM